MADHRKSFLDLEHFKSWKEALKASEKLSDLWLVAFDEETKRKVGRALAEFEFRMALTAEQARRKKL